MGPRLPSVEAVETNSTGTTPEKNIACVHGTLLIEPTPGYILDVDAQGIAAQLRFRGRCAGRDKHNCDQAAPLGCYIAFSPLRSRVVSVQSTCQEFWLVGKTSSIATETISS